MNISEKEIKRFEKTAAVNEIAMMLGRYVTLMDQLDSKSIYEELFAVNNDEVSVEFESCGTYVGPEHARAFMEDLHKKLNDLRNKRGWMDFYDAATPQILVSEDGQRAQALWTLLSPKAKQASAEAGYTSNRKLTAFWQCGKMHWELIKVDGEWKILHFHQLTYFTTEYHTGWGKQQECYRETPMWSILPDKKPRFYVYHPDIVYVQGGQYNWGPYLPDEKDI